MPQEQATDVLSRLAEQVPAMFAQALHVASVTLKARPVYLQRQPFERRADAVRRALSRISSNSVAGEVLAVYFLECRNELLAEWLDGLGLEHENGTLADDAPPPPDDGSLNKAVESFRKAGDDPDRELLMRTFAAQTVIEWPALDEMLQTGPR